jgi:hypothetical protein
MNTRLARNAVQPLAVLVLLSTAAAAPPLSANHIWIAAGPCWAALVGSAAVASERSARRGAAIAAGFVFAWCTLIAAALVVYAITINTSLCGKHVRYGWLPVALGLAVYVAIGYWGFRAPKRPLWAWPVAVLFGITVGVALSALFPGTPGFCET